MINGIRFKVCGLTSLVDAEAADAAGADYLGFVLYPKSPRHVTLEAFKAMRPRLPDRKKVAVVVEPTVEELPQLLEAGFDVVQLHFSNHTPFFQVAVWAEALSPDQLWLAPRARHHELDPAFFPLATTILFDAHDPHSYGGTGKTSDWKEFVHLRERYSRVQWILAGGLNSHNIEEAIRETGADFVDVNSGIESSAGVKDHAKLTAFAEALRHATAKHHPKAN
ncbi:phosphoribosylanthranilate isomerase [Opitutaceae bacterium EW11]|nr:phosphoribosylanthranilate isomerase [Opitutaceae bacterium EW11]